MNATQTERDLIDLFNETSSVNFEGISERIKIIGKPSPRGRGECKTDIYIKFESERELKISVKLDSADFLENKTTLERAKQIFGKNAQNIIRESTTSIQDAFENDTLIKFEPSGRAHDKLMTMGWRYELLNKSGGKKSGKLNPTSAEKIEIYAGAKLGDEKKHCIVNSHKIHNSGVANYILVVDDTSSSMHTAQKYIDMLQPIDDYAKTSEIYFACKALNYRVIADKWEGDRPLCVYVNWDLSCGRLTSQLCFDSPLETKGNIIGNNIRALLAHHGISGSNFGDLRKIYDNRR